LNYISEVLNSPYFVLLYYRNWFLTVAHTLFTLVLQFFQYLLILLVNLHQECDTIK
ncbi:hypothetical protein Nmel_015625, partial [Mimus melanotis]